MAGTAIPNPDYAYDRAHFEAMLRRLHMTMPVVPTAPAAHAPR